jgi:hypothetical protein
MSLDTCPICDHVLSGPGPCPNMANHELWPVRDPGPADGYMPVQGGETIVGEMLAEFEPAYTITETCAKQCDSTFTASGPDPAHLAALADAWRRDHKHRHF